MLMLFGLLLLVLSCWHCSAAVHGIQTDGDIILGGLFPVHIHGGIKDGTQCGSVNLERGIQRLEAMRFAVKQINSDDELLHGVTLGVKILDTCSDATYALDQSLDFVMSSLRGQTDICPADSADNVSLITSSMEKSRLAAIAAVVGAAYSGVSLQVANLLRLFKIPQISYASTGAALSDKNRYSYFMRTVPPDTLQANAMVDIVVQMNWTYLSTVASEGDYGDSGIESFKNQISEKAPHVCFAIRDRVTRNFKQSDFERLVTRLYMNSKARVVVLFVGEDHARGILSAATRLKYIDHFIWVASDGWGSSESVVRDNGEAAQGALTVTLQAKYKHEFDEYFTKLTPDNNKDNIWFQEYWEKAHNCEWQEDNSTAIFTASTTHSVGSQINRTLAISSVRKPKSCTGSEGYKSFVQESKTQFVIDAVYAVALALDKLYKEACGQNATKLCDNLAVNETLRKMLKESILAIDSTDEKYGDAISFDGSGDSLGFYNIMNFRKNHTYDTVGSWENNVLKLNEDLIEWRGPPLPGRPMSVCSLPCEIGQRKEMKDEGSCCWSCIPCEDHEFLPDEFRCIACPIGSWPTADRSECKRLKLQYMKWDSAYAIVPAILSLIGLMCTITVAITFMKYNDTPVVKAAGRELSYMLLLGCAVCYIAALSLLFKPTLISCVIQRLTVGCGFAIVYAALLTKTNRIYRIFASALKTTKRPIFISPKSQVVIALLLAALQGVVFTIWIIFEEPGVRTDTPNPNNRSHVVLKCNVQDSSVLISLAYNMLLIFVCTIFAVLTRKIPSNFNESKFIGFTMYTTCIVWLSFVPVFYGLKTSFQIQITTISTAVILSATAALLCLFGPKMQLIIFHPEKNRRKSTGERTRFSSTARKTECDFVAETSVVIRSNQETQQSSMPAGTTTVDLDCIPEEEQQSSLLIARGPSSGSSNSVSTTEMRDSYFDHSPTAMGRQDESNDDELLNTPTHNGQVTQRKSVTKMTSEGIGEEKDPSDIPQNTQGNADETIDSDHLNDKDPLEMIGLKHTNNIITPRKSLTPLDLSKWDYIDGVDSNGVTPVKNMQHDDSCSNSIDFNNSIAREDKLVMNGGVQEYSVSDRNDNQSWSEEDDKPERLI